MFSKILHVVSLRRTPSSPCWDNVLCYTPSPSWRFAINEKRQEPVLLRDDGIMKVPAK